MSELLSPYWHPCWHHMHLRLVARISNHTVDEEIHSDLPKLPNEILRFMHVECCVPLWISELPSDMEYTTEELCTRATTYLLENE